MIADAGIVWFGLILVIGFVGFFVVLVSAVIRFLVFLGRTMTPKRQIGESASTPADRDALSVCTNDRCGFLNQPGAKFCARCGRPLNRGNLDSLV